MTDAKKRWYCQERPRSKKKDAIFCSKCENLKVKDVKRSEIENFYKKV